MGTSMVKEIQMTLRKLVSVIPIFIMLIGCGGEESADLNSQQQKEVAVVTAPVEQNDFPIIYRIGGTLSGSRQTIIPAHVQTTVARINVKRGETVQRGKPLIMLDPGGVQSQYRQAEALFKNAEKQWRKIRSLYGSGAVAESRLDAAETELKVAKANFGAARQAIEIRAGFEGIVTDIYVRPGDEVSPGMPLVEIADVGTLRLMLDIPTSRIQAIKIGQSVRVVSQHDSSQYMVGEVFEIADAANKVTRSFEVECIFDKPVSGFAPGIYAIGEIELNVIPDALVIPNEALLYRSGGSLVYAIDESQTAELIPVEVLGSANGHSAVSGKLSPGQRVIVIGQKTITPGVRVKEAKI